MRYPPVVVVDKNDEVIGEAPLLEARRQGLIYRIVFVVVKDSQGRVLLQKRADTMEFFPGCWDISASGHVDGGNSYEAAALAELSEEIGLEAEVSALQPLAHFYTTSPALNGQYPPRYAKIFLFQHDGLPGKLGEDEVSEVKWFTMQEIEELVTNHSEKAAEGLLHAYYKVFAPHAAKNQP